MNQDDKTLSDLSDNVDALRKEVSALNLALATLMPVLEGIQKALEERDVS
jgi:prefoldin subunit 5